MTTGVINKLVRDQGVKWYPCRSCGKDWPFPAFAAQPPSEGHECQICMEASTAELRRGLQAYIDDFKGMIEDLKTQKEGVTS